MLGEVQIDRKKISLIKQFYDQTPCTMTTDGNKTRLVQIGMKQGYSMSPSLLDAPLNFAMWQLTGFDKGVHTLCGHYVSFRYADDTTLLIAEFDRLQEMTTELKEVCRKWGMRIHANKCKISFEDRINEIDGEDI